MLRAAACYRSVMGGLLSALPKQLARTCVRRSTQLLPHSLLLLQSASYCSSGRAQKGDKSGGDNDKKKVSSKRYSEKEPSTSPTIWLSPTKNTRRRL